MIILFSNIISGQIRLVNNKITILVFIGLTLVFLGMEFFGFILFGGHSVCLTEFRKVSVIISSNTGSAPHSFSSHSVTPMT